MKNGFYGFLFFAAVAVVFFVSGEQLMCFFTSDEAAADAGTECLHILAIGYFFFAFGMIISQAFNGDGDTRTPTCINLFVFWFLQIPLPGYWPNS